MTKETGYVALRLKAARLGMGYTSARRFALQFDIKYSTYVNHEIGAKNLTLNTFFFYAKCLKINPAWLITGEGHPCPDVVDADQKRKVIESHLPAEALTPIRYQEIDPKQSPTLLDFAMFHKIFHDLFSRQLPADECFACAIVLYNQKLKNRSTS